MSRAVDRKSVYSNKQSSSGAQVGGEEKAKRGEGPWTAKPSSKLVGGVGHVEKDAKKDRS